MEKIIYKKTLDVNKAGIQFTLQGFETADKMARRIELNLMANGDTLDLPLDNIVAMVYVTTPTATEPSINECEIKDNTIIYNVLPIVESGIAEMQVKLIETSPSGVKSVLCSPKFAVEVSESNANDEQAIQTTTYTALEKAVSKANEAYNTRIIRVRLSPNFVFKVYFADGSIYTSSIEQDLKDLVKQVLVEQGIITEEE